MLSREDNETLCRVGRGTPMGDLVRRYWVPALLSSDLPGPDCAPHPFRLFGEPLVAFRDSDGRVGILDEACPHRGASLALGRVEAGGIRCIYHGWKMSCDGTLLDTPNLRDDEAFKQQVRASAYPVREAGDLIWTYLGPPGKEPPFPAFGFLDVPESQRAVARIRIDCNWVQMLENAMDSSHIAFLHADYHDFFFAPEDTHEGASNGMVHGAVADSAPRLEVESTALGFRFAAMRERAAPSRDALKVMIAAYAMPFGVMLPGDPRSADTTRATMQLIIPADDTHTNVLLASFDTVEPIDRAGYAQALGIGVGERWRGDHLECRPDNRFLQDRSKLGESATGIEGLFIEDLAIVVSQGPIVDRTRDRLVPTDDKVIGLLRSLLLENARIAHAGGDPLGVSGASSSAVAVGLGVVPAGASPWDRLTSGVAAPAASAGPRREDDV